MATITKQQAVAWLTQAVGKAPPDDVVEIYNELFPAHPTTQNEANEHSSAVVGKILAHIDKGLEVEEILALWHVIFPKSRRVSFDEDDGLIHYHEKIESVGHAD